MSVLIGTYRGKNLDWIQRENYYNLPIVGAPRDDGFSDISHVILIAKEHPVIAYEATATEVVDQKWLKSKKYSVLLKKPHGEKYQLFKLGKACSWQELLLDATKDIYVWTASFSGKITADFYRKTLPKLGDWSAAYILNKIKPYIKGRKNVFAVATQDDFFELLKTKRQENVPFPSPKNPKFKFIDLFAGIGGFRLAMQQNGGECVFSSEWNEAAQKTYEANYGEVPFGDITSEATKRKIPEGFDILCAGFPCQPFSIAGVSKKKSLGRATGFEDKTQGTLFFDVCTILKRRRPKAFLLENVKNLCSHDKGNTFRVIRESLDELDYEIFYQVIDGQNFVPQHRERILIVGFDRKRYGKNIEFKFDIKPIIPKPTIKGILEKNPDSKYTLSDKLWSYLRKYAEKHKAAGNGFGFGIAPLNGVSRTLSARYYKDGSEILIAQREKNPRRLTPSECARLMGYPDNFKIVVSDCQAYRQFGNSVVMPLMADVSRLIVKKLKEIDKEF